MGADPYHKMIGAYSSIIVRVRAMGQPNSHISPLGQGGLLVRAEALYYIGAVAGGPVRRPGTPIQPGWDKARKH
jgi:hypothetical protein